MSDTNEKPLGQEIIEDLTELCEAIEKREPLSKKFTIRTVQLELKPREYSAEDVRQTRQVLEVSQAVFAEILAVSVDLIQKWEQGLGSPSPMACRLLDLINSDRDDWATLLTASLKEKEASAA